jgi:phosphate-selective porin
VGQFKEPFSYEVLYPEKHLDFVERSNIATSVAPAENIGLMLHNLGKPYSGIIEYGIGVFNGEGFGINDVPNSDMEIASRLAVLPFAKGPDLLKKAKLAASVTYSGDQHRDFGFRPRTSEGFEIFPRPPVDGRRLRWGGDLQWFYGPFSLKAAYMRADEERNAGLPNLITDGWHVDATWLMTGEEKKLGMESGWELAARYEEIQVNAQEPFAVPGYVDTAGNPVFVTDSLARSLTLGLNKYLNYNVKVQVNYQHTWFDNPLLTPTSRVGDSLLEFGDDSVDKIFMRMQLFF